MRALLLLLSRLQSRRRYSSQVPRHCCHCLTRAGASSCLHSGPVGCSPSLLHDAILQPPCFPAQTLPVICPTSAAHSSRLVLRTFLPCTSRYPDLIVVDYTLPTAVNENAAFYCANKLPFVMGTTGGDRERLAADVAAADSYAVIAPNMGKQIVAFQVRPFSGAAILLQQVLGQEVLLGCCLVVVVCCCVLLAGCCAGVCVIGVGWGCFQVADLATGAAVRCKACERMAAASLALRRISLAGPLSVFALPFHPTTPTTPVIPYAPRTPHHGHTAPHFTTPSRRR